MERAGQRSAAQDRCARNEKQRSTSRVMRTGVPTAKRG
jgi:hypothetical protein